LKESTLRFEGEAREAREVGREACHCLTLYHLHRLANMVASWYSMSMDVQTLTTIGEVLPRVRVALQNIAHDSNWDALDLLLGNVSHDAQKEWLAKSTEYEWVLGSDGKYFAREMRRENVLHPGNGWGKTFVIAKKHIRKILEHLSDPSYRTLNIAITQEQAEFVQDGIIDLLKNSPALSWLIDDRSVVKFPKPRIRYTNGAETQFRTTKKKAEAVEGKEYGYISADEIALEMHLEFIRDYILLPRLRKWTDSQLDFYATPKGKNAYYRVAESIRRQGGYVRGGTSYDNPHIDHDLLRYQESYWPENKVAQVIRGEFVDTSGMMFASRVAALFDDSLSLSADCVRGRSYFEGWDLARGRKGAQSDSTVGFRLDISERPAIVTRRWSFQLPWTEKERELIEAEKGKLARSSSMEREIRQAHAESQARVLLDSTGVGDTLYGMLRDIARPFDFRGGNKDKALDHLQAVIDGGLLKSPWVQELADEMTLYQRDDTLLATDNLMALAIAAQSISVAKPRKVVVLQKNMFD